MRYAIVVVLCVGCVLAGWFWRDLEAHAGPTGCAEKNGDVNGDGMKDITDPIVLLGNLFLGNPEELPPLCDPPRIAELETQLEATQTELAACTTELAATQTELAACTTELAATQTELAACTTELAATQTELAECLSRPFDLPATGQTTCHDRSGIEIDCTSDTCAGQDGLYATGCASEGRFVDNGDGTVTDTCAGLMWQKVTGNDRAPLNWCNAVAYYEDFELAGHNDWRLPNVRELQSIVDYGRYGPSIDPVFGGVSIFYWSSTSAVGSPGGAWHVSFLDGHVFLGRKEFEGRVRAVRSGP